MAVCKHVQLVACISLSLLLTLGDGSLITWCQLYIYLHLLPQTTREQKLLSSLRKALTFSLHIGQKAILKGHFMTLSIISF